MSCLFKLGDKTVIAVLILSAVCVASRDAHADQVIASVREAYVSKNTRGDEWTIGNNAIALTVGLDRDGEFRVLSVRNVLAGGRSDVSTASDSVLTIDGEQRKVGSKGDGFTFSDANASELANGVRVDISFTLKEPRLRVTRSYICYATAPVIETFLTVAAAGSRVTLGDFNVWQLLTRAGTVRWVTGLQAGDDQGGSFTVQRRMLEAGERLNFGAEQRASELVVPVFAIELAGEEIFGGIMWPGAWSGGVAASEDGYQLSFGVVDQQPVLDDTATFETPHGFFGVAASPLATSASLTAFAAAIRDDRRFPALVTYNTWFAYGVNVDETVVLDEMERVAANGAEVFVLDAGWYPGAGRDGSFDFTSGVGAWQADEERFPSGLGALSDRAHELGMKFGIWVEPVRTDLSLVDTESGVREAWLAKHQGEYAPGEIAPTAAQICLAGPQAHKWLLGQLTTFLDEVHPDYLKWDNNFFINCDREGHGHAASDGNLRHNQALLDIFAELRARYPDLVIENVSGGGNLLDYGTLRYADVAWMDDRSAPSAHVRHNLEGLSGFLPPSYLFSFVMGNEEEPLHGTSDLGLFARSRMPGALGLTFRSSDLAESEGEELTIQIGMYKTFRETVRRAAAVLLTPQAGSRAEGEWDVLQESADSGDVVLFAFQQPGGPGSTIVYPTALESDAVYAVDSIDRGNIGEVTGRELMANGIELVESSGSAAHILTLHVLSRAQAVRKK